jgi:NitT/TauT family transport system substrate-binding protein
MFKARAGLGRLMALLALVAVVALFVAACGSSDKASSSSSTTEALSTSASTAPKELTTVKTTYMPILALAPLFAGEEAGIFTKNGIKNEYKNVNLYDALPVIAQGREDVGIIAPSAAFFNAINQGQKVVGVADRLTYDCSADNKLVVSKKLYDSGVKTFADLKGKTLAILGPGTATQYWNDLLEAKNGMKDSDFKSIKNLAYPDTLTALQTGGVDAGYLAEPLLSQAIEKGIAMPIEAMYNVVPGDDVGFMIYSQKFAQGDTKTAQAWMDAWLESVRYYLDPANKDAVLAAVSKWTEIPVKSLAKIYGTDSWPYMTPNGEVNLDGPKKVISWLSDNKLIEKVPPESTWYDATFVKNAVAKLGSVDADPCAGK